MKRNYQIPSVKVVAFKVEEAFASQLNVGDSEATPQVFGTTKIETDQSWAGSVIPH